jgi:hypothetical protein
MSIKPKTELPISQRAEPERAAGWCGHDFLILEPVTAEAGVDVVARALAIVGAVTGLAGLAIALLTYRRDRPRIKVGWEASESVPELQVTAVNVGRQPLALKTVYVWDVPKPLWVKLWPVLWPFKRLVVRFRGSLVYGEAMIVEPDAWRRAAPRAAAGRYPSLRV